MSKLNVKKKPVAVAAASVKDVAAAMLELRRTVACCLLWEDAFYESGESTVQRLQRLIPQCPVDFVAAVAIEAREVHQLRHAPLLLARELARHPHRQALGTPLKDLLPRLITRADQLADFIQIYWKTNDGKKTLPAQVKKGLAAAFERFGSYALAKNDHQSAEVKLRDVAFLTHPKGAKPATLPDGREPAVTTIERVYKTKTGAVAGKAVLTRHVGDTLDQLVNGTLPTPNTWEVRMSAAKTNDERRALWLDLMKTGDLGGLAWLRNLRKMDELQVGRDSITSYAGDLAIRQKLRGILPFQFMTAVRMCPWAQAAIEPLMLGALEGQPKLPGKTVVLVDVSGSMDDPLNLGGRPVSRSEAIANGAPLRLDAALALAMHAKEICEEADFWTFSNNVCWLRPERNFRGFELAKQLNESQVHSSTYLRAALDLIARKTTADRTIVITDEQSHDGIAPPLGKGYVMNVASYQKRVGTTDRWTTISGWAPAVLTYINLAEEPV